MQAAKLTCVHAKLTFTAYLLDPEGFYTTYKRGYRCGARRIFESFSVPLGSSGTSNVCDRFRIRAFSPSHASADSAEKTAHRIMAPLLESEYVSIDRGSHSDLKFPFAERTSRVPLYTSEENRITRVMCHFVSDALSTRMKRTKIPLDTIMQPDRQFRRPKESRSRDA